MSPVHAVKNQYLGINVHLHSYWQAEQKWNRFHNAHITDLVKLMKAQLLPLGYTAEMEESLQIRRVGDDLLRRSKSDFLVYDSTPERPFTVHTTSASGLTVAELIEEDVEHPYFAIAIYERKYDSQRGQPVAWVELVLVELDYLHETPPTYSLLLDYSDRERRHPKARPYRIVMLNPRPDMKSGPTLVREFDVDERIPVVDIPLNAGDILTFDFGAAYGKTFEEMLYGLEAEADYTQLPSSFDRYSQADQAHPEPYCDRTGRRQGRSQS
jgi:hypothetical protein